MVNASRLTGHGHGLSDFFRQWGFVGTGGGYAKIKARRLPGPARDVAAIRQ